jgi:hypothetical protein
MQSRYKLTRQIPLTTTYYDATQVVSEPEKYAFAFYPTSGQGAYAGINGSKGLMVKGSYERFVNGTLINSINEAVAAAGGAHMVVLRDLGKTVYAEYVTDFPTLLLRKQKAYFREVQLISITSIGSNGWNGGPNGSTFGVTGYPAVSSRLIVRSTFGKTLNSTSYLTFYIPVTIANIVAEGSTNTGAFAIAGGQL